MKAKEILEFLKDKKFQWIITIILLFAIVISSTYIRAQNLPLLKDQTTGEYIPLALDPFYFLRLSETLIANGGSYPIEGDNMRNPSLPIEFAKEILPQSTVILYKFARVFNPEVSLRYINVLNPVIFYILGIITFFVFIFFITKSKLISILSSTFLAFIPPYLYRTMAGFSDHESIGMFGFFLAFFIFAYSLEKLSRGQKIIKNWKVILMGILTGFFSAFSNASWGGMAKFIFMIFPLTYAIIWLSEVENFKENNLKLKQNIFYYGSFVLSSIIFIRMYGYSFRTALNTVTLSSTSLLTGSLLAFIILDYFLITKLNEKKFFIKNGMNLRILYSTILTFILGIIGLIIIGQSPIQMISSVIERLLHPFGIDRIGLTVVENAQPYLTDWISQVGNSFFIVFCIGLVLVGIDSFSKTKSKKHRIGLTLSWAILILSVLFSRYSSTSIFNGQSVISKGLYFLAGIWFVGYITWVYFRKELDITKKSAFILSWAILMIIAGRGAVRLFFAIVPFMCFIVAYSIVNILNYLKSSKEELTKLFLTIGLIIIVIFMTINVVNYIQSDSYQAKYTGPSATEQWQNSMAWVRENTPIGSQFVHWWDYGYWVETLGERPATTDGGHANGYWDHLIGRYVLTTNNPDSAKSFMKSQNASYLLIDPTDIGKYPAYSTIGSDNSGTDRYSYIVTLTLDEKNTQETKKETIFVYNGGFGIDENIIYEKNGSKLLLPKEKTYVLGIMIKVNNSNNQVLQPQAVFVYNNQQIYLPMRYLYYNGKIMDFKEGLNFTARVVPSLSSSADGASVNPFGAVIFLSQKTTNSLIGQLYILNDAFGNYREFSVAHSEDDSVVNFLKVQGAINEDFVYYGGIRGPIKIWEYNDSENIIAYSQFTEPDGEYAGLDNLKFKK